MRWDDEQFYAPGDQHHRQPVMVVAHHHPCVKRWIQQITSRGCTSLCRKLKGHDTKLRWKTSLHQKPTFVTSWPKSCTWTHGTTGLEDENWHHACYYRHFQVRICWNHGCLSDRLRGFPFPCQFPFPCIYLNSYSERFLILILKLVVTSLETWNLMFNLSLNAHSDITARLVKVFPLV